MSCDITLTELSELLLNSSLKQYKASTDGTVSKYSQYIFCVVCICNIQFYHQLCTLYGIEVTLTIHLCFIYVVIIERNDLFEWKSCDL